MEPDPGRPDMLRNLVGNAVEHTPPDCAVRVTITPNDTCVAIAVSDDGAGIAAGDLPRIFERFWRAVASRSRAYGGSGLGLAMVEANIQAHHGQVTGQPAAAQQSP